MSTYRCMTTPDSMLRIQLTPCRLLCRSTPMASFSPLNTISLTSSKAGAKFRQLLKELPWTTDDLVKAMNDIYVMDIDYLDDRAIRNATLAAVLPVAYKFALHDDLVEEDNEAKYYDLPQDLAAELSRTLNLVTTRTCEQFYNKRVDDEHCKTCKKRHSWNDSNLLERGNISICIPSLETCQESLSRVWTDSTASNCMFCFLILRCPLEGGPACTDSLSQGLYTQVEPCPP